MKNKTEIQGEGWGSCHNWREVKFSANDNPILRYSTWKCRSCFAEFNHMYNYIPNIFKCMEACQVPNFCTRKLPGRLEKYKITGRDR